jgi:NAD(P)-dependent dehydrogenase (short-subunit alcohol dehydrogenase family)
MACFIVTGASSGIGRATASALAARGVTVLAAARSSEQLAELQAAHDGLVCPVAVDLATSEGIAALIAEASEFDRIDGIVHAAGSLVPVEPYGELDPAELTRHFGIHVATPIDVNNRLGERLRGGRIVYVDSYSASSPRDGWSGYSVVKAAAQMAAKAASQELSDVDIIRIFPGGVRTPLVEAVLDAPSTSAAGAAFRSFDAAGQIAEPDEIGAYIAHVVLDVPAAQLGEREFWDYGDPETHASQK